MPSLIQNEQTGEISYEMSAEQGDFAGGLNELPNIAPNESPKLWNVYADDTGDLKPRPNWKKIGDTPDNVYVKTQIRDNLQKSEQFTSLINYSEILDFFMKEHSPGEGN